MKMLLQEGIERASVELPPRRDRDRGCQLREEIATGGLGFLMEAHNGLSAKLAEEAGFRALWASGLGEERTRSVDVRIIAATNRDLRAEVQAKRFREDLFFRLNVFPVHSPSLHERRSDIPLLASHFLQLIGARLNMPGHRLNKGDMARLKAYDWPGNIRELQNVIERALITATGAELNIDLPSAQVSSQVEVVEGHSQIMTEQELRTLERDNVCAAMAACGGKLFGKDGAAELLGIKPTTLASRLKKMGIS